MVLLDVFALRFIKVYCTCSYAFMVQSPQTTTTSKPHFQSGAVKALSIERILILKDKQTMDKLLKGGGGSMCTCPAVHSAICGPLAQLEHPQTLARPFPHKPFTHP